MTLAPPRQNPGKGRPRHVTTDEVAELLATIAGQLVGEDEATLRQLAGAFRVGAMVVLPEDLVGTKEAAELLRVDRTTVSRWKRAGYLPRPFAELATGPVWLRPVLEAFHEQHRAHSDAAGRRAWGSAHRVD